mgnify:CR=1 FL=1|jgi:hypothetical protein
MDLQDYKIKNSTTCDCGYHFTVHNITELKRIGDDKFYGGVIKHVSETKCPQCNKSTLLFLKQVGQTYEVKDIAQKSAENIKPQIYNNTEQAEMTSSANTNESDNLTCPNCKRSFKSKSGLANHLKSCQK